MRLQSREVISIYLAHVSAKRALIGPNNQALDFDICKKYVPINMSITHSSQYILGSSPAITKPVISRKGIVSDESGHTSDKSPYFTALRVVILPILLKSEAAMSTQNIGRLSH